MSYNIRFIFQSAMINISSQENDATLTEKFGCVLKNKNSLYNWFNKKRIFRKKLRSEESKVVLNDTNFIYNQLRSMISTGVRCDFDRGIYSCLK